MAGPYVRDAEAPNLLEGVTLDSAGSDSGAIVDLSAEHTDVTFELVTDTVSGTTPTLDVEIECSPSSTFASGVVSLGRFAQVGDEDNATKRLTVFVPHRYVRASVVAGGTSPDYDGTTLVAQLKHYRRLADQTA